MKFLKEFARVCVECVLSFFLSFILVFFFFSQFERFSHSPHHRDLLHGSLVVFHHLRLDRIHDLHVHWLIQNILYFRSIPYLLIQISFLGQINLLGCQNIVQINYSCKRWLIGQKYLCIKPHIFSFYSFTTMRPKWCFGAWSCRLVQATQSNSFIEFKENSPCSYVVLTKSAFEFSSDFYKIVFIFKKSILFKNMCLDYS